jgi:uncharacterized lipoprotein NlpE involved in copper resistance
MAVSLLRGCDSRSDEQVFRERLFATVQTTHEQSFAVKGEIEQPCDERVFATGAPVR